MDELLHKPERLGGVPGGDLFLSGDYEALLESSHAQALFSTYVKRWETPTQRLQWHDSPVEHNTACEVFLIGLASFNAFIQANVTGPPLQKSSLLFDTAASARDVRSLREKCLSSLDVDGLSIYQHIPHIELFTFARAIFNGYFPVVVGSEILASRWVRVRINVYHQRLLSSSPTNSRLSDSATGLQEEIDADLSSLEKEILGSGSVYGTEAKVQFVLEKAQIYIMQGLDLKASENISRARDVSGFTYAMSGALGKRTRFQQTDISQLVVFAKSSDESAADAHVAIGEELDALKIHDGSANRGPTALALNDDTLLESIEFAQGRSAIDQKRDLPEVLEGIQPDAQPQLKPLDQITLLAEATLKDEFSPQDKLNSEEILPYAVRVLSDKPTNWQIFTQALLVRSRIEAHRSRTQERSVLQLQAIVDQIVADTQEGAASVGENDGLPTIQVTQFLPRAKAEESATVTERIRYVHQLNSPTRWEVETELAYAWSRVGSFMSALAIFKRLKLWPEIALCYHSVGQVDKATQVVRRQLFCSTGGPNVDDYDIDDPEVVTENWDGEVRIPPPPHAPRLWCILGDLEQNPAHWERAWQISNKRYARAQRTLAEYYTRQGDLLNARDSYMLAATVNRQHGETWSRLGDIDLKVANWDGAIIAFQQAIMIDDSDARTYSNLGSALLGKYTEQLELQKLQTASAQGKVSTADDEDTFDDGPIGMKPKDLLRQALIAYKKAASIAHDNWKIWDNVVTIAGRMQPPSYADMVLATRSVLRIRTSIVGEAAVDIDVLRVLVAEVISHEHTTNHNPAEVASSQQSDIYIPPRGSLARAVIDMVDTEITPLITRRAALYEVAGKLALWRRDYAGALACAEKAWRMVCAGEEWATSGDVDLWREVADATETLVSAYENFGTGSEGMAWKGKARSAVRSVLAKAREVWEDSAEYAALLMRLEELKS